MRSIFLVCTTVIALSSCAKNDQNKMAPLPEIPTSLLSPISQQELEGFSSPQPPSLEIPSEPSIGQPLKINPESIRRLSLEGNTSILLGANRIHQAREQLNVARGNLFPSISLETLLTAATTGFGVASAEFLLPFLMPHKWFENFKAKNLVEAEKSAYLILQLNQYASAMSLYFTHLYDLNARISYLEEVKQFERVYNVAETAFKLGIIPKDEMDQALAELAMSRVRVTRLNDLIVFERALLRHTLGLTLQQNLEIETSTNAPSPHESLSVQELVDKALKVAPENKQVHFLMKAAENEKWAKIFGFVNIFSLVRNIGSIGNQNGTMTPSGANSSLSIGLGTIPNIRLSNNNKEQLKIQLVELKLQMAEVLERTTYQLATAKIRLREAQNAETALTSAFEAKLKRFELGMANFTTIYIARTQLRAALLERLKSESEINNLRTVYQRALIEDQFSLIQGCNLSALKQENKKTIFILSWFKDIFAGSSKDWISIERICAAKK